MNHGVVINKGLLIFKDALLTEDFILKIYELLDDPGTIQQCNASDTANGNLSMTNNQSSHPILSLDEEETVELCADSSSQMHGINGLDFWNCLFEENVSTVSMLSDVIMVFSETVHLQKLFFSNNSLTDDHLQILCDGLIYLYDLRELRIVSNEITYSAFNILSDAFCNDNNDGPQSVTNHKLLQNLEIFDLSDNVHLFETHHDALSSFQSFVSTVLMDNECNLQSLRLTNSPSFGFQHIDALSLWLSSSDSLQHLDLSQNSFDLAMIQSLCDCTRNLETLILNHCSFTIESAHYLGSHLSSHHILDTLSLNGMPLLQFMKFAQSSDEIRVKRLSLNELKFRTADNWYDVPYGAISDVIVHLISVKCLFLEYLSLNLGDLHNDEVNDMAAFLGTMPWIRTLSLRNNRLSHGCLKKLSHSVKQSQKIAATQTNQYCRIMMECIEQFVGNEGVGDKESVGELNRFTEDISYIVVEYLFKDPLDGLRCILLQGNESIDSQFTANFRNCSLLDARIMSKVAKTRWDGRRIHNSMSHLKHKQLQWSKLLV